MSGGSSAGIVGATLEQTAAVLGVGRATVARLQTTFRRRKPAGPHPLRNWGGRRQALLTPEEERAFLNPWLESAAAGNLVVVSRFGRPGATAWPTGQTLGGYRLLAGMVGERWPQTRDIPRATPPFRRMEKNSRKCWDPALSRRGQGRHVG